MIAEAAERLLGAYVTGPIAPLSETHPGLTLDDAYRIQQWQVRRWLEAGDTVRGHKIGLASTAMQRQMGVDQPDYGHLTDTMFRSVSEPVPLTTFIQPRVEPEVAFVLKGPLRGPGLTVADVIPAIEYALPALEIVDSRVENWRIGLVDTVADNASSGGVLLGDTPTRLADVNLPELSSVLAKNDATIAIGTGAAVLGSPLRAVAWLANKLGTLGVALDPGHVVLSGSFTQAVPVLPGDTVSADFGDFGRLSVTFGDQEAREI